MVTAADDLLHEPPADRTWTETWWYPVYVPEHSIAAYLYAVVRPVAGVVAGGVIVWDEHTDSVFDALYADYRWADPFVPDSRDRMSFPSGLSVEIIEPMQRSHITYRNADEDVDIDVVFTATAAPHDPSHAAKEKGIRGHFDQPGLIVGTLRVGGRVIDVRSPAMRDRSWGSRPDAGRRWWGDRIGYSTVVADGLAVLAVSHPSELTRADVFDGFVERDGSRSAISRGTRHLRYADDGRIVGVELDVVDDAGRTLQASGRVRSACTFQSIPAMTTTVSMTTWIVDDDRDAVGEDQDVWWQHSHRAFARTGRASGASPTAANEETGSSRWRTS